MFRGILLGFSSCGSFLLSYEAGVTFRLLMWQFRPHHRPRLAADVNQSISMPADYTYAQLARS
jgi:hypothetical protein